MISPTFRAVWLMLLGVPIMLVIAIISPALWIISAGWIAGVIALTFIDAMLGARLRRFEIKIDPPALLYIGSDDPLPVEFSFTHGPLPVRMDIQVEVNPLLEDIPAKGLRGWQGRTRPFTYNLRPLRRGMGRIERVWARWSGPLGLAQKSVRKELAQQIPITPNVRWVKEEAIRLFSRDAEFGIKMQIDKGDGSEFDALREFTTGMDRRAIDWKHSARHRMLLAKEFRTERNHNIVFAFDTGRLMSEPLGGVPKIDRAINAGLLLSYVSLRNGDRTSLFGFDARPELSSGFMSGTASFPQVQALAARMDYSANEANYTLALTQLAAQLERRSLIIIFSDFVDTISAELMVENVQRLAKRHLIVFATFEDEYLGGLIDAVPETTDDVTRAVIADTLLSERDLVFRRLRRLGVQIIETRPEQFGAELVSRYLEIKRREML